MKKGFTLVELMICICILGILAAVLVPKLGGHFRKHSCEDDLDKRKKVQDDVESIHDTVYVHDTIYVDKSYDACVKTCKENNKSQSVIDFCIKEECK